MQNKVDPLHYLENYYLVLHSVHVRFSSYCFFWTFISIEKTARKKLIDFKKRTWPYQQKKM